MALDWILRARYDGREADKGLANNITSFQKLEKEANKASQKLEGLGKTFQGTNLGKQAGSLKNLVGGFAKLGPVVAAAAVAIKAFSGLLKKTFEESEGAKASLDGLKKSWTQFTNTNFENTVLGRSLEKFKSGVRNIADLVSTWFVGKEQAAANKAYAIAMDYLPKAKSMYDLRKGFDGEESFTTQNALQSYRNAFLTAAVSIIEQNGIKPINDSFKHNADVAAGVIVDKWEKLSKEDQDFIKPYLSDFARKNSKKEEATTTKGAASTKAEKAEEKKVLVLSEIYDQIDKVNAKIKAFKEDMDENTNLAPLEELNKKLDELNASKTKAESLLGYAPDTSKTYNIASLVKDISDKQGKLLEFDRKWAEGTINSKEIEEYDKLAKEIAELREILEKINAARNKDKEVYLGNYLSTYDNSVMQGELGADFKGMVPLDLLYDYIEMYTNLIEKTHTLAEMQKEAWQQTTNAIANALQTIGEISGDDMFSNFMSGLGDAINGIKSAMEYYQKLTTSLIAVGAMKAGESLPFPYNLAAIATYVATALSTVNSIKSRMQSFAGGGIVGGTRFSGDSVLVRANSGEMLLNDRQQGNLFNLLDSTFSPNAQTTIDLRLKGEDIVGAITAYNKRKRL